MHNFSGVGHFAKKRLADCRDIRSAPGENFLTDVAYPRAQTEVSAIRNNPVSEARHLLLNRGAFVALAKTERSRTSSSHTLRHASIESSFVFPPFCSRRAFEVLLSVRTEHVHD